MPQRPGSAPVPISPELILVSPDLEAEARRRLPDPGTPWWRGEDVLPSAAHGAVAFRPPIARTPLRRRASAFRTAVTAAAAFGALMVVSDTPGERPLLDPGTRAGAAVAGFDDGLLCWPAHPRATYYNVQVFSGERKVQEEWPEEPCVRVAAAESPATSRSKRYRWAVWPGLGDPGAARYGDLLAEGHFTVALPRSP